MPYPRPTLSDLKAQVAQDIASGLPGADPLLRFSNLNIIAKIQANLANGHYGYLDWISLQTNPFTATDEFLEAWAALKNVFREPATQATGSVTFSGTNGTVISAGQSLVRGDGVTYTVTAGGTVTGGTVTVPAQADADPSGLTGAFGNCDAGTVLTLGTTIAGINSSGAAATPFTGGADLETDTSLRSRMLAAYQSSPKIGTAIDYINWAREVPGVTRAWVIRNGAGSGTVVVYTMLDSVESAHGGFPQGTDGVATGEWRDVAATGDQLLVANHIFALQPVTALVFSVAPIAHPHNFTISGLAGSSTGTRNAIAAAITEVFLREGAPGGAIKSDGTQGGTVLLEDINAAIAAVPLTSGFVITVIDGGAPGNIVEPTGNLPTLGTVTYV